MSHIDFPALVGITMPGGSELLLILVDADKVDIVHPWILVVI